MKRTDKRNTLFLSNDRNAENTLRMQPNERNERKQCVYTSIGRKIWRYGRVLPTTDESKSEDSDALLSHHPQ